ncbi:hypothetical protein Goshw_002997, partial [Gossypium schwendimanii]|nr:hypothetical protein [Gossypium schwendimanii]
MKLGKEMGSDPISYRHEQSSGTCGGNIAVFEHQDRQSLMGRVSFQVKAGVMGRLLEVIPSIVTSRMERKWVCQSGKSVKKSDVYERKKRREVRIGLADMMRYLVYGRVESETKGKPYSELSSSKNRPVHSESGYWCLKPDGSLEVVISQSTGLAKFLKGTYSAEDNVIKLHSQVVANASK